MENFEIKSSSPKQTMKYANQIASHLHKGNTIILCGDLGAGKTKFVEGFLSFFGLENEISSPTFNIVNEYSINNTNIYHFDVYRLEDTNEFYEIGGDEYFEKGICLIEWGELISDALPPSYLKISISLNQKNENERILNLNVIGNSEFYYNLLDILKEELY